MLKDYWNPIKERKVIAVLQQNRSLLRIKYQITCKVGYTALQHGQFAQRRKVGSVGTNLQIKLSLQ